VAVVDYVRFESENIAESIEWIRAPDIQFGPDRGPVYPGLQNYAGPLVFPARPNSLGWFLLSALGTVTTAAMDVGVRWRHTFAWRRTEFSAASFLQPLTLEIHRDMGDAFRYAGSVINDLTLEWGIGQKILRSECGVMAAGGVRIAPTAPTPEALDPFLWRQQALTLPDPTAFTTMRRLNLAVRNNQTGYDYLDGTQEVARILPGDEPRAVEISGEMIVNDAEYRVFRATTQRTLRVVFTGPTLGTGSFRLEILAPRFRYESFDIGVTTQGHRVVGFSGTAEYDPAVANTPLQMVLDNSRSSY
jgi:hypothetical protein